MIGAPEYEFATVGPFFSCGAPLLLRTVLTAYGLAHGALDEALSSRLLAYSLLHRYSHLAWYLERIPPPSTLTRLDELARHFFGVRATSRPGA